MTFSPIASLAAPRLARRLAPWALATLGACAAQAGFAQSSVQVFGLVDVSVGSFEAPGGEADKQVAGGNMTTSFLGFKGREELGGGLAAIFSMEHFLRADSGSAGRFNGDNFWARNAWVGVTGEYGTLTMGRNTTALFVSTLVFNAFGDSFGFSPSIRGYFTSGTATGDSGWSDSVSYSTPKLGGFSATLQAAMGEGVGGNNVGGNLLYFGGPFAASLAYQKVEKGAGSANDTTTWQLGGWYDASVAKLFVQYGEVTQDATDFEFKLSSVSASVPVGAGKLIAAWGRIDPESGAKRTTASVGYDHQLSKRTDVYGVYMNDKIQGLSAGDSYALGIRHRF